MKRRPAAARRIQNLVRRAAVAFTSDGGGGGCPVTLGGVARILTRRIVRSAVGLSVSAVFYRRWVRRKPRVPSCVRIHNTAPTRDFHYSRPTTKYATHL
jgi:hypothetical protein